MSEEPRMYTGGKLTRDNADGYEIEGSFSGTITGATVLAWDEPGGYPIKAVRVEDGNPKSIVMRFDSYGGSVNNAFTLRNRGSKG